MQGRAGAISIHEKFRGWTEELREGATSRNIELSKEEDVLRELSTLITADPEAVLIGYNMAGLDTLAINDAVLRCGVKSLFDASPHQMDLYRSPIVKAIKISFPQGAGRCRTDLRSLRHIIELASPDYFEDVVGNWHDAACDAHV